MEYKEAINKINSSLKFGVRPGLERIKKLLNLMNNPQDYLKFIHVAGTNGKGSTCTFISSILKSEGYKTGLFTSPFIVDFRERMQINNCMISKEELSHILSEILPLIEQMAEEGEVITEFELITAIAFKWFYKNKCDIVVLEVGLGGRLDATNVINTPIASVITSVSLDHTSILGDTLDKIALEKCGIIKRNGITIVSASQPKEVLSVISEVSNQRQNRLVIANYDEIEELSSSIYGTKVLYKDDELFLPLVGSHQVLNVLTAIKVIEEIKNNGIHVSKNALKLGILNARIPARMELLSDDPIVFLDGAHNPDGSKALLNAIGKYLSKKKLVGIMGVLKDKDSDLMVSNLAPLFNNIITLTPKNPRGLDAIILAKRAKKFCNNVIEMSDKNQAITHALKIAGKTGAVVVCGSLYLAGELRPILIKTLSERQKQI